MHLPEKACCAGAPDLACPEGLEPPTCCLEGSCSIQLSYGQVYVPWPWICSRNKARGHWGSTRAFFNEMVGAAGFELATLCSQSRCATRLRYAPTKGAFYMGSAGHAGWTQLNFAKLQRFLYCVCPKSTSFSASVRNGLRRSASTATPRCTAGRAAMRSNQALSAG